MSTQHTPTPWRAEHCNGCGSLTLHAAANVMPEYNGDGNVDDDELLKPHFISGQCGGAVRNAADAAFIVLACNNFEPLLEAAEAAQEGVHNLTCLTSPIGNKGHYPLCNLLRAAVADARRTT